MEVMIAFSSIRWCYLLVSMARTRIELMVTLYESEIGALASSWSCDENLYVGVAVLGRPPIPTPFAGPTTAGIVKGWRAVGLATGNGSDILEHRLKEFAVVLHFIQ
jgi:hypothetical protein